VFATHRHCAQRREKGARSFPRAVEGKAALGATRQGVCHAPTIFASKTIFFAPFLHIFFFFSKTSVQILFFCYNILWRLISLDINQLQKRSVL
jgi:hypothetical protein